MPSWKKVILSGSDAALNSLNVTTAFTASGLNYPTTDNGEESFLQTNGSGNLSFQYVKTIYEEIYNGEATTITKGTPVYVSGSVGAASVVFRADAGNPTKMPVIYISADNIASAEVGRGIALGLITGVDTTGYPAGTEIYVAVGGGWTSTRPTGSAIVQTLGYVTKEGAGGQGVILNPGPNSLPNLTSGSVWVGNSSSIPTAVTTSSLSVASASFATTATQTSQAVTFNNAGAGAASGTTFNGSTARTISHNTIGAVPTGRTITINGTSQDLSANRTYNVGTVTSIATNNGVTGGTITSTGTIGLTGQALALHNLATNGLIARTGVGTVAGRTLTGTANQITVTNGNGVSGNPTISLPATITGLTSVTSTTFVGALTGNATTATTATIATNVTATANNSTNETTYLTFVDGATGTQGIETDTALTYNPSTNILTAGTFSGALSGNATSATTATNATNIAITNTTTTAGTYYPVFVSATTGNVPARTDSSTFTYNPNTNTLTVTNLSGNATTATTATNSTNATVTTSATNSNFKIPFANTTVSTTGNYGLLQDSEAVFTYNPSTNTFAVPIVNSTTAVRGGNGSAGAPAFSFSADTDTGMYSIAEYTLGFATKGGERMRIDSSGRVGIGQSTIQGRFHVYQTTNLGGAAGNSLILQTLQNTGGVGGNQVYIKDYAVRDATGTDWNTWRHHNSIDVDGVYNTPGTNTRTFWERDPLAQIQYFGSGLSTTLTINSNTNTIIANNLEIEPGGAGIFNDGGDLAIGDLAAGGFSTTIYGNGSIAAMTFGGDRIFVSNPLSYTTPGTSQVNGEIAYWGGGSVVSGSLYYYNSSGNWVATDADAASTATGMLGIARATGTASVVGMLLRGRARFTQNSNYTALTTIGAPLYVSTTPAAFSQTAPTGTGDIVRIIGYVQSIANDEIYFCPDNTWVEIT
jgi:hypothetical protein